MIISFLLTIVFAFSGDTPPEQANYCRVYGLMYETMDRREADFLVYEEASDAFADILIYEHENRLYANAQGNWAFTDNPHLADYILYFVEERRQAHFSVYFTDFESFAGCNR